MVHRYAEIAFTGNVRQIQTQRGSRQSYARLETGEAHHDRLDAPESAFIENRDSFYMASVSETGWPYIQHRGGPRGFLRVLDDKTIGFADFSGNRQYISIGNLAGDDRVSLFLMDYADRSRLKILGRAHIINADDPLFEKLLTSDYRAIVERGIIISVEAFDWNCRQHITPRFSREEISEAMEE